MRQEKRYEEPGQKYLCYYLQCSFCFPKTLKSESEKDIVLDITELVDVEFSALHEAQTCGVMCGCTCIDMDAETFECTLHFVKNVSALGAGAR